MFLLSMDLDYTVMVGTIVVGLFCFVVFRKLLDSTSSFSLGVSPSTISEVLTDAVSLDSSFNEKLAYFVWKYRTDERQFLVNLDQLEKFEKGTKDLFSSSSAMISKVFETLHQQHQAILAEVKQKFDDANKSHVQMLVAIHDAFYTGREIKQFQRLGQHVWGNFGFLGSDPATELGESGLWGLRQFVSLASGDPDFFRRMVVYNQDVQKQQKASHWFHVAMVCMHFSANLIQQKFPLYRTHVELIYQYAVVSETDVDLARGLNALYMRLIVFFFDQWQEQEPEQKEFKQWVKLNVINKFFSPNVDLST